MEHKIYNWIRKHKIPLFLRIPIMIILLFLGFISILLPLPFSIPLWVSIIILWVIFIIWARDLKSIKKIRRWTVFFVQNILDKKIRNHKIKDIKKHIKQILDNNK